MKKRILTVLIALITVLTLCFTLAGCDKSGSIKKAFEDEGYTVTTVDTNNEKAKSLLKTLFTEEQIEKIGEYEIILCVGEGLGAFTGTGMVIKFPSEGEIKNFLTVEDADGNKDTKLYDSAKENGSINGNCLYLGAPKGLEIFKNA